MHSLAHELFGGRACAGQLGTGILHCTGSVGEWSIQLWWAIISKQFFIRLLILTGFFDHTELGARVRSQHLFESVSQASAVFAIDAWSAALSIALLGLQVTELGLSLLLFTDLLDEFLDLLELDNHDLYLILVKFSHTCLLCFLGELQQLVIVFVRIPMSQSLQEFGIVVFVHLRIHLEQFLSQSLSESIHRRCLALFFLLFD